MAYDIEDQIVIDAPPEQVWRWTVEEPELEQRWRNLDGKGVQELERLDDGPLQVGSRFRGSVKVGPGKPQGYVNEITTVDAPKLVSWETVDADGSLGGRGNYRLEPLDRGRTRFTIQLDYPPRTLAGHLMRRLILLGGPRMIAAMLAKLKRLVEADAAAAV